MTITLNKNNSESERQHKILSLQEKRDAEKQAVKKEILEKTFGSVKFDKTKTAIEIQEEMRDEWN